MNIFTAGIGMVVVAVALICIIGLILSLPVMLLWNGCLVSAVNGINEIGWLQSWGILILTGLLFRSSNSTSKS